MFLMQLVVKSQILAGGRGLGTFQSGLKGGVHIVKADEVEAIAGTVVILYLLLNSILFSFKNCMLNLETALLSSFLSCTKKLMKYFSF